MTTDSWNKSRKTQFSEYSGSFSGKGTLLIFNPDTDFALGSGSDFYTPPKAALAQMRSNPMIASLWGKPGDTVLLTFPPDGTGSRRWLQTDDSSFGSGSSCHGFRIILLEELHCMGEQELHSFWNTISKIEPWGWNKALCRRLHSAGAPAYLLPTTKQLENLRTLAHRRTTIGFNRLFSPGNLRVIPTECFSESEALRFLDSNPGCWFKLPWSSSGRGVLNSAVNSRERIAEWVRGGIRRQGSVFAETGADKTIDFASEWKVEGGNASLLGLSLFVVSARGQYMENAKLDQDEIFQRVQERLDLPLEKILTRQKKILGELIVGKYEGFVGIDMMAERDGTVRPCVEINMRRTMGMLRLINSGRQKWTDWKIYT